MDELMALLKEIRPDVSFHSDMNLIDDAILDSIDIVSIVSEIGERFQVDISVDQLTSENFNSPEAILKMIERMKAAD